MGARRAAAILLAALAALLVAAAPAVASHVSAPGLRLEYVGDPGEVNQPVITFHAHTVGGATTADVQVTDTVPITVSPPCVHTAPANPQSVTCTVELTEELPSIDLGDRGDRLTVRGTEALVLDGPGNDSIFALTSALWVDGPGNDTYRGGRGRDVVRRPHGFGADRIYGGSGDDLVYAGPGADRVYGGPGEDLLYGDAGNDRLYGGKGDDLIRGGPGLDTMFGGPGRDRIDGALTDFARG